MIIITLLQLSLDSSSILVLAADSDKLSHLCIRHAFKLTATILSSLWLTTKTLSFTGCLRVIQHSDAPQAKGEQLQGRTGDHQRVDEYRVRGP